MQTYSIGTEVTVSPTVWIVFLIEKTGWDRFSCGEL